MYLVCFMGVKFNDYGIMLCSLCSMVSVLLLSETVRKLMGRSQLPFDHFGVKTLGTGSCPC